MAEWFKALVLNVEPESEKPTRSKILTMSDIGFLLLTG